MSSPAAAASAVAAATDPVMSSYGIRCARDVVSRVVSVTASRRDESPRRQIGAGDVKSESERDRDYKMLEYVNTLGRNLRRAFRKGLLQRLDIRNAIADLRSAIARARVERDERVLYIITCPRGVDAPHHGGRGQGHVKITQPDDDEGDGVGDDGGDSSKAPLAEDLRDFVKLYNNNFTVVGRASVFHNMVFQPPDHVVGVLGLDVEFTDPEHVGRPVDSKSLTTSLNEQDETYTSLAKKAKWQLNAETGRVETTVRVFTGYEIVAVYKGPKADATAPPSEKQPTPAPASALASK